MNSSHKKTGLTIIEILVVLGIIAIITTVVSIRIFSHIKVMKVNTVAEQIKSHIRLAQERSKLEQTSFAAQFNTSTNNYKVYNTSSGETVINPLTRKDLDITFDGHPEFDGVTIDSVSFGGSNEVSFDSLGQPSSSGSVTISYGGENSKTISVEEVTGRVSVQ